MLRHRTEKKDNIPLGLTTEKWVGNKFRQNICEY